MNKEILKTAKQIKILLDKIITLAGGESISRSIVKNKTESVSYKGASGAIAMLTDEGFFDSPKNISAIMKKLEEIGRYYPQTTVAMNLLNLTKRRIFNRLKDKQSKNWLYVLKK